MGKAASSSRRAAPLPALLCNLFQQAWAASSTGESTGRFRALQAGLAALMLLLGITTWMWHVSHDEVMQAARTRFHFEVSEAKFAIEQRLLAYEQVLRGGVGLFAASDEVERHEWRAYVETLNIDKNYSGIQGIGFSARIDPAQREAHIRKIRAEGFRGYTIRPDGEREEYTSIVYLEPFDWRNQRAFGYDMFSEPVRREAMMRAREHGVPAMSGNVTLVQETQQEVQRGFLMYLPVYKKNASLNTAEERRAALLGYVYAPFRMNDLMRGILGREKLPHIRLEIFDSSTNSPESLLYDSSADTSDARYAESLFTVSEEFESNGRKWSLRFRSLPVFDAAIDVGKARLILFGGILVSILIAAVLWSLLLNRHRARELANVNRGLQEEIAERVKLEEQLKQAKEVAESANQAKSHFLANVSHELRTPLTLILAPVEQLLGTEKPMAGWRMQLERILRNALVLLNRVNDILDFSKAEAGKFDVRWEAVDLSEVVPALAFDAAAVAERKGCSLTWHVDPALGQVCADSQHIEKILLNLVSNALKFTPEGGWVRVEAVPLDDKWFELSVSDSGIGIPADKQPLLFKRFEQVDASATRQYGGTGVGLTLVKELVELMGGSVGVQSEAGHGARFFARLPRGADRLATLTLASDATTLVRQDLNTALLRRVRFQEGSMAVAAPEPERDVASPGTTAPQVLVVDDSPDMRTYIADLLREECDVFTASDGLQAWELLQRREFDVVVSDVMMPELDGLGLTTRIKGCPSLSHLPVILVTARGGAEASASGLERGADDYLAKPFSPQELRARVRAALRMGQIQEQLREKTREAGVAMFATGILHNLGNVLNGITVTSTVLQDKLRQSKATKLTKVAQLLLQHAHDLPGFFDRDSRAQALPDFVAQLAEHLEAEHKALLKEADALRNCAEHASGVITTQRQLGSPGAELRELVSASSLVETALSLAGAAFEMQGITIERDYVYTGAVVVDRHKVLQILMNLLSNAGHALRDCLQMNKCIAVRIVCVEGRVRIAVSDSGVGIDPRHLPTLFNQGFTTKGNGHGYGLHSSANWAHELGGALSCRSNGPGRGATFTLELPVSRAEPQDIAVRSVSETAMV